MALWYEGPYWRGRLTLACCTRSRPPTKATDAHDVPQTYALLHGQEDVVFVDSGYKGVEKRPGIQYKDAGVVWKIAIMLGNHKALDKIKASIRVKVEHSFQLIKCKLGHRKTLNRGLAKNTSKPLVLLALSNVWMIRKLMIEELRK